MKRRNLAPVAILVSALLAAAAAAASGSSAHSSPAVSPAGAPEGAVVSFKSKRKLQRVGVSAFAPGVARPDAGPITSTDLPQAVKDRVRAIGKVNRITPGKLAGKSDYRGRLSAATGVPTASSLPILSTPQVATHVTQGLSAFMQSAVGGYETLPPDPALCAGPGYVVQLVNDLIGIYDAGLGGGNAEAAESFFAPAIQATGFDYLYDPVCYYDTDTGKWFLTYAAEDAAFSFGTAEFIAVSSSSSPLGTWNIYVLDTTHDGINCAILCFGDFPKIGANKNALVLSTNSYTENTFEFNGTQLYVIDKSGLALGLSSVNLVYADVGASFAADGFNDCGSLVAVFCWNTVQPAQTPAAKYSLDRGGTELALSSLDWYGSTDNRLAIWAITGTSTVNQLFPAISIQFRTFATQSYGFPPLAAQRSGPIPYGNTFFGPPSPGVGPIATNGDYMNEVKFVKTTTTSYLWGALNTIVQVPGCCGTLNTRAGIAYWAVRPVWAGSLLLGATIISQGYVANAFEDVTFPSMGVSATGTSATMAYTLTGNEYFPSAAFSRATATAKAANIQIAAAGRSPNDDVCEYGPCGRPRWGDYSTSAVWGDQVFSTTQYIPSPNCSDVAFVADPTCGGTRSEISNWGTALISQHS